MQSNKQVLQSAQKMKNTMRMGPSEIRQQVRREQAPQRPEVAPRQPVMGTFTPEPPPRHQSVYMDLMKKHDSLNPRRLK